MLNATAIGTALTGLVGWHDGAGPLALDADLLKSESSLYVQDVSELLVLPVLQHLVPPGETLSNWITRLHKSAIVRFVSNLTAAQSLDGKVLLPQTPLVKRAGRIADTINKQGRFVGIELQLVRHANVSYTLPRVSLQLDKVLTQPLDLYLYSAASPAPVDKITVPANQNKAGYPFQVTPADPVDLSFAAEYGGRAWLGYYEDELPTGTHAIQGLVGPCGCTDDPYGVWSKYVIARPFAAPADFADVSWQDEDITYSDTNSYGLNPEFIGYCDIATALESEGNKALLAPLVQQAIAIRFLEALSDSTNITQVTGRQDVQADALRALYVLQAKLYGGKVPGTEEVYPSGLKNLVLDISELSPLCTPQKKSLLSMGRLVRNSNGR